MNNKKQLSHWHESSISFGQYSSATVGRELNDTTQKHIRNDIYAKQPFFFSQQIVKIRVYVRARHSERDRQFDKSINAIIAKRKIPRIGETQLIFRRFDSRDIIIFITFRCLRTYGRAGQSFAQIASFY